MASPPKPWERQGATPATAASTTTAAPSTTTSSAAIPSSAAATSLSSNTPAIPAIPTSLTSAVNQNAAQYSRGALGVGVGASPYGAYGSAYSSPYSSPYSRLGGYGGGLGGGMYGSGYGGYGGGMYGGGMYGGMPGMQGGGDPNDPNSLTQRFGTSTQATFQMLEGVVGAFGGFAQMLESTYMATHSSFFAMVSVAEQFGNLRDTLGSILGIFTLMRWIRTLIAKITGRPPPADATALTPAAFARFEGRQVPGADGQPAGAPKPSRKPLFFFVLAAFGLPYLMSKVIKSLAATHEEEERRRVALQQEQQQAIDPTKLEFCRVMYDFTPEQGPAAVPGVDLAVRKGDFVAVLSKADPLGNPSEWWRCRTRDGRQGYLPGSFLGPPQRPGQQQQPVAAMIKAAGAASEVGGETRTNSLTSTSGAPALPASKVGDVTAESFQKSAFYH